MSCGSTSGSPPGRSWQVCAGGRGAGRCALTGKSVDLASRLTDAAGPGETLDLEGLIPGALRCDHRQERRRRAHGQGLDRADADGGSRACATRAPRPAGGRSSAAAPSSASSRALSRPAGEAGSGLAVYVRGEAGIGKSRLVDEFRRVAIAQGLRVTRGSSWTSASARAAMPSGRWCAVCWVCPPAPRSGRGRAAGRRGRSRRAWGRTSACS